jgi:glutathione S-transferase
MNSKFRQLDQMIGEKKFLVGENISIADIMMFHEISSVEFLKHDISEFKNIIAFTNRLREGFTEIKEIDDEFKKGLSFFYKMLNV